MNAADGESVHEGEAFLVLLGDFGVEFLGKVQLLLLIVVVVEGGLDVDAGGHHCGDGAAQGVDLEEVGGAVEVVELLGGEFGDECAEVLADDVLDDAGLDLGGLLDVVVEGGEDVEDELESGLVDIGDFDLSVGGVTCPCSMALASRMYSMSLSWFSVSS